MNHIRLHNEEEIVLKVSEGDEKAFLVLYRHYYAQLKPVVLKYFDSDIDKDEILQLAFLKVWFNREKLPAVENLNGWIYKVAYREYLIAVRKKLSYENKLNRYSHSLDSTSSQVLPQDAIHMNDIRKIIDDVVSELSPQRKKIYELSRGEGMKISEIADQLSISPQTVKNVLFIVLKTIREKLVAAGYGPLSLLIFFTII